MVQPAGDVDLVVDARPTDEAAAAGLRAIGHDLLEWGVDRRSALAPGHDGPLRLWATEGSAEAALFEGLGMAAAPTGDGFHHLTGRIDGPAAGPPHVPANLEVRAIADPDVPARVRCGRAAFVTSTMTPERYRRTFLTGGYRHELDRVVVDGTGSVLAFALGWFDPPTRVVELEPVGVHPDHHRHGLGTLVCRSALGAAAELGATRAMIAADRRNAAAVGLYRSLGLSITSTIVPFPYPVETVRAG